MLFNLGHFPHFYCIIIALARQFSDAYTSTTLVLRCAITLIGLRLLLIPRQIPTGILTKCAFVINLSRALHLEFDSETFCTKDSIT